MRRRDAGADKQFGIEEVAAFREEEMSFSQASGVLNNSGNRNRISSISPNETVLSHCDNAIEW